MLDIEKEKLDKEIYKKYEKLVLNYFYYTNGNLNSKKKIWLF